MLGIWVRTFKILYTCRIHLSLWWKLRHVCNLRFYFTRSILYTGLLLLLNNFNLEIVLCGNDSCWGDHFALVFWWMSSLCNVQNAPVMHYSCIFSLPSVWNLPVLPILVYVVPYPVMETCSPPTTLVRACMVTHRPSKRTQLHVHFGHVVCVWIHAVIFLFIRRSPKKKNSLIVFYQVFFR